MEPIGSPTRRRTFDKIIPSPASEVSYSQAGDTEPKSRQHKHRSRWSTTFYATAALCLGAFLILGADVPNGSIERQRLSIGSYGNEDGDLKALMLPPTKATSQRQASRTENDTNIYNSRLSKRRTKVHLCPKKGTVYGREMLLEPPYDFQSFDATISADWDLIYGGYSACGDPDEHDWEMEQGLNKIMKERGDWQNMKPHQAFHPCLGCQQSYCYKHDLCKLLRDTIDPKLCYVLPEDLDRLKQDMTADKNGNSTNYQRNKTSDLIPFVLKSPDRHGGKGVHFLWHPGQINKTIEEDTMDDYIVQKWMEPHLYPGIFHRKTELRIHIAITSVEPLRAYYHKDHVITFAATKYTNTATALMDRCMVDTSSSHNCDDKVEQEFFEFLASVPNLGRQILFEDYAKGLGMSAADKDLLMNRAHQLTADIIRAGNAAFASNPINKDIQASGAMCFSHMRVDLGIGEGLVPFFYEVTEIPSKNSPGNLTKVLAKDLFHMVGLDAPVVPPEERAAYELTHLGGWRPLLSLEQ